MHEMGVNVAADRVYPDLAFSLPNPPVSGLTGMVGVGVMAYYGGNDDRDEANRLHQHYMYTMTRFVHWLLDSGRKVRLYPGDQEDQPILRAVLDEVRAQRTDDPDIEVETVSTLEELMRAAGKGRRGGGFPLPQRALRPEVVQADPVRRLCGQT